MQRIVLIFILLLSSFMPTNLFSQDDSTFPFLKNLTHTHDLSLPDWGPYTKKYIGISHIPDAQRGIRFDLSVFPGFYRRKIDVPNVFFETEYHPWEASPNYEYFSFRHELEWKDRVYTDISYSLIDENSRLIRIECMNQTDIKQNIAIHFMASIHFPSIKEYSPDTPIYPGIIELPDKYQWIDALDYKEMEFAKPRPTDNLGYDGKLRGEIRGNGFINGSGLGNQFGRDEGDRVVYDVKLDFPMTDAVLYLRYRMKDNEEVSFSISGLVQSVVTLKGSGDFDVQKMDLGNISAGLHEITLISKGGDPVEFDGFIVIESGDLDAIQIKSTEWHPIPEILNGPDEKSVILKYKDIDMYYGVRWDYDLFQIRQWFGKDLGDYFRRMANNHVRSSFEGEGDGHFTNIFLRPIVLQPKSEKTLYAIVCSGSKNEVENRLLELKQNDDTYEAIYEKAKTHIVDLYTPGSGEKYVFSQQRMSATTLCNVVYPVYTQRSYIKHSTPGRWWDCLYTWDSGFIGLGLLELDRVRAIENLNAYTMEPGAQSAFLHHGTPLPVQLYLFLSLWNETQSEDLLKYFYPRLKQYHQFLAGRLGSSTTRNMKSNLIRTWDYFYNSGGWDDYPPQKYVHDNKMEDRVTPVINTAHCIRTAKILKMAAVHLKLKQDISEYERDIQMFSKALRKYSWDEASGYFGYVVHDDQGNPLKILKYNDEVNYNMGLGGCYPILAGICSEKQKAIILGRLKSDQHLWSRIGLSAVDQSAPYFKTDGYWNGTVWMPHQWFFWKTMLDLGESEFAYQIAITGLDVWKKEVEASYNCMEHFLIETGRGAGWHEFSGLSTPVLSWYAAYFRPGNITTGFNIWIQGKKFTDDFSRLSADLLIFDDNEHFCSVVVCMNPSHQYNVFWNDRKVEYKTLSQGTLGIDLNTERDITAGTLKIERKVHE